MQIVYTSIHICMHEVASDVVTFCIEFKLLTRNLMKFNVGYFRLVRVSLCQPHITATWVSIHYMSSRCQTSTSIFRIYISVCSKQFL